MAGTSLPGLVPCYFERPMGYYQDPTQPLPPDVVGLPVRPFLYTCDQISGILSVTVEQVRDRYLFYEGRSVGVPPRGMLKAVNIAGPDDRPEWRVAERELIRWMRFKGFRWYEAGWITH